MSIQTVIYIWWQNKHIFKYAENKHIPYTLSEERT